MGARASTVHAVRPPCTSSRDMVLINKASVAWNSEFEYNDKTKSYSRSLGDRTVPYSAGMYSNKGGVLNCTSCNDSFASSTGATSCSASSHS